MNMQYWAECLKEVLPYVTEIRREFHTHPEISGQEFETKKRILRELNAMGSFEIHEFEGACSVMATLQNGEGPCIGIRADIDALPMQEETGLPFASVNPGVMHACGHDNHIALALGSAKWFSTHKDQWHGTVRYLFEAEEETNGGGKAMVEQGCLQNPTVDYVIGQHVNPNYPAGVFFCKTGYVSGSSTAITLTVKGTSCHGAYPERGVDAIVIAAQIVSALQSLISRRISPFDPAVLTFGMISGGTARNIVCDQVTISGTMRTLSDQTRAQLKTQLAELAQGIARGMGGDAELEIVPGYGAVYNDDAAYAQLETIANELLGAENVITRPAPSLGVESFCYFLEGAKGVYWDIGTGVSTALHTTTMVVDGSFLLPALALQIAFTLKLLEGNT